MVLDPRSLQWATLAHKSLPQRALVTLLREFQDPGAILAASPAQLSRHVPANVAAAVLAPVDENALEATARWIDDAEHHVVAWDDTDYPQALLDIGHAPPVIFFVGRRALLNRPALAIVGSRHATPQGQANAREFAKALAAANLTIVSGLALGIDAAAHEGALGTEASTLAVIGTGADRIYPAGNRELARRIAQTGGILSEFVPGTPARKENFPRRNRLISGLARGVLVVEATLSSGSLITARWAVDQGRDVFAVPGRVDHPMSRGCHRLLREGAQLLESPAELLGPLGLAGPDEIGGADRESERHPVLSVLHGETLTADEIAHRQGLALSEVLVTLVELQLAGAVVRAPGGLYRLAAHRGGT